MLSVFAIKAPISSSLQTNRFCTRLVNAKSVQTLEIQANLQLTLQIAYEQEGKVIEGLKICALSCSIKAPISSTYLLAQTHKY